jgi:hypothetical protein
MWHVVSSSDHRELNYPIEVAARGMIPQLGDYDGDGKIDFAIWQGADQMWRIRLSGGRDVERAPSELKIRMPERKLRN